MFGTFYVTGWGRVTGGGLTIDDPCTGGNNGNLFDGTGNEPPPDLNQSRDLVRMSGVTSSTM